jgi:single-stranded DNA-binding protein
MAIEVALDGRLGNPPQSRTSPAGKPWTSFSLAADVQGEDTEWVSVAAFGDVAAGLPSDLSKGERLYVEGKLTVWRHKGPGGLKASLSVAATRVEVLDRIGKRRRRSRPPRRAVEVARTATPPSRRGPLRPATP